MESFYRQRKNTSKDKLNDAAHVVIDHEPSAVEKFVLFNRLRVSQLSW